LKAHIIVCYPVIDDSCIRAGIYASYRRYSDLKGAEENPPKEADESAQNQWDHLLAMKNTWLAFMIISAVALVIVLLLVIFLRNRIRIAVALIKEASK
jgi:choline transporter-like protein 2/4/5